MKSAEAVASITNNVVEKVCSKCGEKKPIDQFHKKKSRTDGYNSCCKICNIADALNWRNNNPEKAKELSAAAYLKNPDRYKKQSSDWYKENKQIALDRGKEYRKINSENIAANRASYRNAHKSDMKNYRDANKGKISASWRLWNSNNKEQRKEYMTEWRVKNSDKQSANNRNRRSRKKNAVGSHTAADIRFIFTMQKNKCAVCSVSITNNYHVDHIIPLARGGHNSKDNLQLLCPGCNLSKHAKDPIEFMQERRMLL